MTVKTDKLLLIGCGILKKEILWLIEKNLWPLDTLFLDSSLHINYSQLEKGLTGALARTSDRKVIVFYGACHPLRDRMMDDAKTFRTEGQNCIDMLLGNERFTEELLNGAYFLFEDWVRRWEYITAKTFGTNRQDIVQNIFQKDRKYLLGIKTPCSGDFRAEATGAAKMVGLPLRWTDVSLEHLESVIQVAITKKIRRCQI